MTKQIVKKKTINNYIEVTSKRKLSIQFSLDGFSFCTTNTHNEVIEFSSYTFSDQATLEAMKSIYETNEYIAEPHGAVGYLGLKKELDN